MPQLNKEARARDVPASEDQIVQMCADASKAIWRDEGRLPQQDAADGASTVMSTPAGAAVESAQPVKPRGLARLTDPEPDTKLQEEAASTKKPRRSLAYGDEGPRSARRGTNKARSDARRRARPGVATTENVSSADFKLPDTVIALPGEDLAQHHHFQKTLRQYLGSKPLGLYEQCLATDVSHAQHQLERLVRFEQAALTGAIKDVFLNAIRPGSTLSNEEAAELWSAGQPTRKGLKKLAKTGATPEDLHAGAFLNMLSEIVEIEKLAAYQRGVRNNSAAEIDQLQQMRNSALLGEANAVEVQHSELSGPKK